MSQLHTKYRPRTFDQVIGQEAALKRLRGIVEKGDPPSSMLFTGPSSSGKTSLARVFVAELFGVKNIDNHSDYRELNAASSRGIDDIRDLMRVAKLRPRTAVRRVILMDEVHGLTGPSMQLILKPVEEPPPFTVFLMGSSEPEKLPPALKNRPSGFVLTAPTQEDLTKYVNRVCKGEFGEKLDKEITQLIVNNSNGVMREAANIVEAISQSYPKGITKVKTKDIVSIVQSVETNDDAVAVNVLAAVYAGKMKTVYRQLLDVEQGFAFISKLLTMNSFLINQSVLGSDKHKAVWWSKLHVELKKAVKEHVDPKTELSQYGIVQSHMIDLKNRSMSFMVPEYLLIGDALYRAHKELKRVTLA